MVGFIMGSLERGKMTTPETRAEKIGEILKVDTSASLWITFTGPILAAQIREAEEEAFDRKWNLMKATPPTKLIYNEGWNSGVEAAAKVAESHQCYEPDARGAFGSQIAERIRTLGRDSRFQVQEKKECGCKCHDEGCNCALLHHEFHQPEPSEKWKCCMHPNFKDCPKCRTSDKVEKKIKEIYLRYEKAGGNFDRDLLHELRALVRLAREEKRG